MGGGVAVVSELLWRVLQDEWGPRARLATIFDDHVHRPSLLEKAQFAVRVAAAQARQRTDWVLFSHLGPALVQCGLPAAVRQPYAVFLHGIEAWGALTSAQVAVLKRASLRLSNSGYTARRIMDAHPAIGPVVACPLALPPRLHGKSGPVDAELLGSLGSHVVLVVGRMASAERYKGHDQLLAAWSGVLARIPDAQLVIVGDGDDRLRLMGEAATRGINASVRFTGFVSSSTLQALYERCALFALPSRGEGFGLVYLEAMRQGKPCIGAVHDAAADVIEDGVTGRLIVQDDISGMSRTLASLLLDSNQRQTMGTAGQRRVAERFEFDRFRRTLRGLLDGAATPVGQ